MQFWTKLKSTFFKFKKNNESTKDICSILFKLSKDPEDYIDNPFTMLASIMISKTKYATK